MGCQLVLVIFFLWIGRTHFKKFIKAVFSGKAEREDNEPLSYRWAFLGFINSAIVLGVLLSFCMTCTVMTWLVVHSGMPFVHGYFRSDQVAHVVLGTRRIGPATMTILAIPSAMLFRDMREFIMPNVIHAFKMSYATRLNSKHLLGVLFLSMLLAAPLSLFFDFRLLHREGAANSGGLAWANNVWLSSVSLNEVSTYIGQPRR